MSNRKTKYHCNTNGCKQVISVGEVVFPLINDEGGMIFTCNTCHKTKGIRMLNPVESFYNLSGVRPLESWVDYEEASMLAKHGLTVEDLIDTQGYRYEPPKPKPLHWPGLANPLYECGGTNYESGAYAALEILEEEINRHYMLYLNAMYVKRRPCDRSFVVLETELDGEVQRVIFSKNIDTERNLNNRDLLLVHHSGIDLPDRVDGIYSKTECLDFLKKLLLRWKQLADSVLIVVPFVGYPYKGSEAKNLELWEFLNTHTDAGKTQLVTRSASFGLFKKATDKLALPFATLQEWDFLTDMTKVMNNGDNAFLQRSHAKFYTGIFDTHIEVLSGSFNINIGGPSLENISLKVYSKERFNNRYLQKVRPGFVFPESESLNAHYMVFRGGKFVREDVTSLGDFKTKYFFG